jgi:hypothetical protein
MSEIDLHKAIELHADTVNLLAQSILSRAESGETVSVELARKLNGETFTLSYLACCLEHAGQKE